jgi:putative nucleotidyltransferase with HDIG domain
LGYEVCLAVDGEDALRILEDQPVDLVLSDLRMPRMGGLELLQKIRSRRDDVGFVLLTGCDDVPTAVTALREGALDYLVKPSTMAKVAASVDNALAKQRALLADKLASFEAILQVGDLSGRLQQANMEALELLVAVLDARESETMHHSKRVSEMSVHLGQSIGLSSPDLDVLRRGALLHDVGKVGLPDAILGKPGELTEEERLVMQRHPEIGYRILQSVASLRPTSEIVLAHHACFDGSGYPVSWSGDRIPLGARIFTVIDSFDAMVSNRPYRRGTSYEEARQEITRCAGTQFDPALVAAFNSVTPETWMEIRERVSGSR